MPEKSLKIKYEEFPEELRCVAWFQTNGIRLYNTACENKDTKALKVYGLTKDGCLVPMERSRQ